MTLRDNFLYFILLELGLLGYLINDIILKKRALWMRSTDAVIPYMWAVNVMYQRSYGARPAWGAGPGGSRCAVPEEGLTCPGSHSQAAGLTWPGSPRGGLTWRDTIGNPPCDLPSLAYRRRRGDMIQTYKIINGIDRLDKSKPFTPSPTTTTRGHRNKLYHPHAQKQVRRHSFSFRVLPDWNSLPPKVIESDTLNAFKRQLDDHWKDLKYEIPL